MIRPFKSASSAPFVPAVLAIALFLPAPACGPAPDISQAAGGDHGHDHGHDHGDEGPAPVRITRFEEDLQLYLEYPRLYPGVDARFLAHLTRLPSGEPLAEATVRMELIPEGGESLEASCTDAVPPGLFIPVLTGLAPGEYGAKLHVQTPEHLRTLELPPVIVHESLAKADAAAHEEEHHGPARPADAISLTAEQQWTIGLQSVPVERRDLKEEFRVNGTVVLPPNRQALVSPPLGGRLLAPAGGSYPKPGEAVKAGQELARVALPFTTADQAQALSNRMAKESLAMELALREYDLRTKRTEASSQTIQSQSTLTYAEKTLKRITELREQDLGTVDELEQAVLEREMAVSRLAGLEAQHKAFAEAEEKLRELAARLETLENPEKGLDAPATLSLRAPISGVIQSVHLLEGQMVGEAVPVFDILNINRVWVEAHVPEDGLQVRFPWPPRARVQFAKFCLQSHDLGKPTELAPPKFDPVSRTLAMTYELINSSAQVREGMRGEVYLETGHALNAASIPLESVVKEDGRPIAFVMIDGETFQRRELELGIRSGSHVQVLQGFRAGERVVTRGAYLLKLASAAPASFGHGHVH